jgi:hypothetical protein
MLADDDVRPASRRMATATPGLAPPIGLLLTGPEWELVHEFHLQADRAKVRGNMLAYRIWMQAAALARRHLSRVDIDITGPGELESTSG